MPSSEIKKQLTASTKSLADKKQKAAFQAEKRIMFIQSLHQKAGIFFLVIHLFLACSIASTFILSSS